MGFIFGVTSFLAIIFSPLCVPECKGMTLEEIDALFERGAPLRKFRTYDLSIHHADTKLGEEENLTSSKVKTVERPNAV